MEFLFLFLSLFATQLYSAENIPLAKALESSQDLEAIAILAALDGKSAAIVSPCGICRELLYDYAPELNVILSSSDHPHRILISDEIMY